MAIAFGQTGQVAMVIFVGIAALAIVNALVIVGGRTLYAIGGNAEAALVSGIPVQRVVITAFAIMGGIGLAFLLPFVRPRAGASRGGWQMLWLGAGFMLIEVSVLQRFVLLLGHPVYSLTVTLFSLLLGTRIGRKERRKPNGPKLSQHPRSHD